MFQHPALRKNTRSRSFGVPPLRSYVVVKTDTDYNIAGKNTGTVAWKDKVKALGLVGDDGVLKAGAVVLLQTFSGSLSDYRIITINGKSIDLETDILDMGNAEETMQVLVDQSPRLFDIASSVSGALEQARAAADAVLAGQPVAAQSAPSSAAPVAPAAEAAPAAASATVLKTGYYEGNRQGRAIYYNAERGYIEVIAARPDAGFTTQPKYMRGSAEFNEWEADAKKYPSRYQGTGSKARKAALAIAIGEQGKELPEPGRGGGSSYTPSTAPSTAPATTPASGTPAPSTGGKKGIPGWVWWTSGTVLVAGLGVWGAIMIKKNKAAAQ